MKILFVIGHPAHVHLFKNMAKVLEQKGHKVYYAVCDIPIAKRIMEIYGMPYIDIGRKRDSIIGKAWTIISRDLKLFWFVLTHNINMGLSSGIELGHVSKFTKMKAMCFDDDDDWAEKLVVKYGHPFCNTTFTPNCIKRKTKSAIYYAGTHELAYLHPKTFSPDYTVLKRAGINKGECFFIMRFVAFKAHHDIGHRGLSVKQKEQLVNLLSKYGRVIITSERKLEDEFEQYRLPVPPEDIHSLMYYASLYVGDSQTMTSEAGLLGVPALKCNTFAGRASVPNMYEDYGLTYAYQPEDFDKMYHHIENILANPNAKEEWIKKRDKFLEDMIDPTKFFVWYVENYPESKNIMKNNPDYQYNFR